METNDHLSLSTLPRDCLCVILSHCTPSSQFILTRTSYLFHSLPISYYPKDIFLLSLIQDDSPALISEAYQSSYYNLDEYVWFHVLFNSASLIGRSSSLDTTKTLFDLFLDLATTYSDISYFIETALSECILYFDPSPDNTEKLHYLKRMDIKHILPSDEDCFEDRYRCFLYRH